MIRKALFFRLSIDMRQVEIYLCLDIVKSVPFRLKPVKTGAQSSQEKQRASVKSNIKKQINCGPFYFKVEVINDSDLPVSCFPLRLLCMERLLISVCSKNLVLYI